MRNLGWRWIVWCVASLVPLFLAGWWAPSPAPNLERVVEVAKDRGSIVLAPAGKPGPPRSLAVAGTDDAATALRKQLGTLNHDDLVKAIPVTGSTLQSIAVYQVDTTPPARFAALGGAALLLLLFVWAALGADMGRLIVGLDGRTSNSKTQIAIWFGVLLTSYLATLWLRFYASGELLLDAVTIPNNLLMMSGMSAITFAGAKAITQSKENARSAAGMSGKTKVKKDRDSRSSDLAQDDDGNADFGDTQMILITLISAITYLVQIFMYLHVIDCRATVSLPDVDGGLLTALGIGHGTYLVKKVVAGPGTTTPNVGNGTKPGVEA